MAVFALYKQDPVIKAVIIAAFAAEIMAMTILVSFVIREQTFAPDCIAATSPRIFIAYWYARQ